MISPESAKAFANLNVGDTKNILDKWLAHKVARKAKEVTEASVETVLENGVNYLGIEKKEVAKLLQPGEEGPNEDWLNAESFGLFMVKQLGITNEAGQAVAYAGSQAAFLAAASLIFEGTVTDCLDYRVV